MFPEICPRTVDYYVNKHGRAPFKEWLNGIKDAAVQARIEVRVDRLRMGHFGDCKSVGGGVLELRIDCGPGYRIYFGLADEKIVLLLCGGDKNSQGRDIEKAKTYWADFRRQRYADKA